MLKSSTFTAGFENYLLSRVVVEPSWRSLRVLTVEEVKLESVKGWECLGGVGGAVTLVIKVVPKTLDPDFYSFTLMDGEMFEVEDSRIKEVVVQFPNLRKKQQLADLWTSSVVDYWENDLGHSTTGIARRMAMLRFEVV